MATKEAIKGKIYKCPTCGSLLNFDPKSFKLKCIHCNSFQELTAVSKAFEIEYNKDSEVGYVPWGDAKTLKCRSCGAEFAMNTYETASNCPFCGTSNIMLSDDVPGIKPNAILPFRISQDEALQSYLKWLKKRTMSPNNLKKQAEAKNLKGLYVPVFTFDASTQSRYTIRYGIHRTVTVGSGKNRRTVVVTDWYQDSGVFNTSFNDVQVEASQYLNDKNLYKTGYFDSDNAYVYNSQYIAGFYAERYSTGLDDSWAVAKDKIDASIRSSILSRYNYDELDYLNVNTNYNNKTYKYLLAPIWLCVYNYKGKEYKCIINGRNGAADGVAPLSKIKVAMVSVAAAAVVGTIIFLVYKFLME